MDRRRFVPSADGLEERKLLSFLGSGKSKPPSVNINVSPLKNLRIDRLPFYLQRVQQGRYVPADVVTALQNDLLSIAAKLKPPPSPVLQAFNEQLRGPISKGVLTKEDAAGLNVRFGQVLEASGANAVTVARFQADMQKLAQVDVVSKNPGILAASDYALLTQMAMGIGQPLPAPAAPKLLSSDNTGAKNDRTTSVRQPQLYGNYSITGLVAEIVDKTTGNVLGAAKIPSNGRYQVQFAAPLSLGEHTVFIRVVDANGGSSYPGAPTTITIVPPTTVTVKGPHGKF